MRLPGDRRKVVITPRDEVKRSENIDNGRDEKDGEIELTEKAFCACGKKGCWRTAIDCHEP